MKKYRVTVNGTVYEIELEELTGAAPSAPAAPAAPAVNQQELIAAVSAAIAEDLGTDITGIRILSIKKV